MLSEADPVVVARFERAITAGHDAASETGEASTALVRNTKLGRESAPVPAEDRPAPIGLDKEVEEDDVNRRELLACLGVGLAGTAAELVVSEPERMLATLDAGSISERRLGLLEQTAEALGAEVVQVPPHQLLQTSLEQFRMVRGCLGERQATIHQIRLVRTAGRLANVVGEILFNEGHFGQARLWYTTAIHAAQDIGDRYSEDIALAGMSYLPTYSDRPEEVLALLEPRLAEDPRTGAAAAWLWGMAARAHAEMGQADRFQHCVEKSALALDSVEGQHFPTGIFSFRPEKLSFYKAIGYARLGRAEETAQAANEAISLYDPRETMEPALVRFEHATALLRSGEVDEACAVATAAITDQRTYVGLTVSKRAKLFDAALSPQHGRARSTWREQAASALRPTPIRA
ncbi:hypothetical protein ACTD5D_06200 [Nocardia takedensis]|uniref:hypothetical protein n=1 Tax=Nocardia takedensis TaxID=259390 RepID=UPI0005934B7A